MEESRPTDENGENVSNAANIVTKDKKAKKKTKGDSSNSVKDPGSGMEVSRPADENITNAANVIRKKKKDKKKMKGNSSNSVNDPSSGMEESRPADENGENISKVITKDKKPKKKNVQAKKKMQEDSSISVKDSDPAKKESTYGKNDKSVDNPLPNTSKDALLDEKSANLSEEQRKLNELQCPFTWKEFTATLDKIGLLNNLHTALSRPSCNNWKLYCLNILLGCVHSKNGKHKKACTIFSSCKELVNEKAEELFFKDMVEGMHHVIEASECYAFIQTGHPEKANDHASFIKPFKDLSTRSQAAIWATKAYLLCNFGYNEMVRAFECAQKAIKLDPDDDGTRKGAWYYLAGSILFQHNQSKINFKDKEAMQLLVRSVRYDTFPVHLVVLADKYRETGRKQFENSEKIKSDKSSLAALNTYRRVLTLDASAAVFIRCGYGLLKLPKRYRIVRLVEEAFKKALKIEPKNPGAVLALGNLEEWHKENNKAALSYYEELFKLGDYRGAFSMIKMQYALNKSYNPVPDCDKFLSELQFRTPKDKIVSFMVIKGEYYLNVKNDLLAAAQEWEKAFKSAPKSSYILEYKCIFKEMQHAVNIYDVLRREVAITLKNRKLKGEKETYLDELLKLCQ